jgi:hypothetical protein
MTAPQSRLFRIRLLFSVALVAMALPTEVRALTADDYETIIVEGWTVHVENSLVDHPRRAEALALLQKKLFAVRKTVPSAAVPKLREVPIWLSRDVAPGAAYHPSADWLLENGRVVEMERSIEIMSIDDFIDWSTVQPWMMLHELAHAYHHRFLPLGYENGPIKRAYKQAVASRDYNRVLYHDRTRVKHYALTNQMEFFAESTEAYFGKNDFEPFNKKQLRSFDVSAYRMVEKAWGVKSR